ncbi:cell surface protein precursor [Liquorilactobacillus sucicola DSM 21376 = JCM 15457]|uniref:DUF916 and DUF3324 domain-containing protein n=1 Tax=Liquorilactobacillus sucicola TaxID=519050 RepID=UPI00043176EE|nr:DUF916 and DUF3324 domain-containing protein [Liquorilactobacillus sucicola]GAJ27196.1 cell surface protein precursor [Liquorilactobacillus sucicola DSM 21376 = JCM 15457]
MNSRKNFFIMTLSLMTCLISLICLKTPPVHAEGAGFTVAAVTPPNQFNKNASYFDLKVTPGQAQDISVQIQNLTSAQKKVTVYPNTGYTSNAGVEAYDKNKLNRLSRAPFLLSEILGRPQKIILAPHETKTLTFSLKMPQQKFHGILEGALYFLDDQTSAAQQTNQKGMTIRNRYALALGIVLREDTQTPVAPKMKMNKISAGIQDTANFSAATKVNLENTRPAMIKRLQLVGEISRRAGSKVLYRSTQKNLGMAPNSNFDYSINWRNDSMKVGRYHMHLTATSGKYKWVFDRNFNINRAEASNVNKKANIERNWTWLWILLGALLVLLIFLLAFFIGRRSANKKKANSSHTEKD